MHVYFTVGFGAVVIAFALGFLIGRFSGRKRLKRKIERLENEILSLHREAPPAPGRLASLLPGRK